MGRKSSASGCKKTLLYLNKSHRIIFHILCDMGLQCSKLNNSNHIKDRNIIFAVSKRYINHLKKISNFISFINHLYRNKEKV